MILNLKKSLLLLLFTFIIGFFIVSVLSALVTYKWGANTAALRILTMLQDIVMFILPAIATALLVTRRPATLLAIDRRPPALPTIIALCVLIVSIPAMNYIIWLNEQMPLPSSLAQTLRDMEDAANATIACLQGPHTVPNLIMTILIVGIMAGLSEELLFRGAFQRIMTSGGVNVNAAIWVAALVFSLMHMQFYGMAPRMLLGAFFGYALLWTRSLWTPIILHAVNNTMYLCSQWIYDAPQGQSPLDAVGSNSNFVMIACSAVLTAVGLWLLRRNCQCLHQS